MSPGKLFNCEDLRKFSKNAFLIHRSDDINEQIFKYEELFKAIEIIHENFKVYQIASSSCFAVGFEEVSFDVIALLIGILNYGGHFCPLPKNASKDFLDECSANFLCSSDASITEKIKSIKLLVEFTIVKKKFCLYAVNEIRNCESTKSLPSNMCYTISTTGTTGKAKMVHVPYECIEPNISSLCHKFQLISSDVIYLGTPFTFDPFVVELFLAISAGAAVLLTKSNIRFDKKNLLQLLWPKDHCRSAVSIIQMTPTNFRQFGSENIRQKILALESKLRILILGGEDFPRRHELMTWLPEESRTHVRIFNIYGITELSCWSTIHEWDFNAKEDRVPIGLPLGETLLRIISTIDGQDINNCGTGELFVGSATRKTYIPHTDATQRTDKNVGILYRPTGDLVERTNTGDIYYVGRLNDIIKRMGKRICLTAMEQSLAAKLSTLGKIYIVFLWHEEKQNLICCFKVENADLSEVKSMIIKNLAEHEKPDRIVEIQHFPLNKHNKLDRKELLKDVLKRINPVQPFEKFTFYLKETLQIDANKDFIPTKTQKRLKLKPENVLMAYSFTAAGGSSFQALSLATEIGETLESSDDQRTLLRMLLDAKTSIFDISNFLKHVAVKKNNLETVQPLKLELSKRKLKIFWRVNMAKCIDATPTLSPNGLNVCIGSHAGLLLNVDSLTGEELSRFKLRDRIECQVAFVSPEIALVGCDAGFLYCFDFLNGQLKWSLYIGSQVKAKPLVINNSFAIIGCYDADFNLAGVCLQTVKIKWRKKIGTRPIFSTPILLNSDKALICALDGTYECLNVRTNQIMWSQKCDSPIFSTPRSINEGNKFLLAEVKGKVHLCVGETGHILQSFQCDGNIFSNITIYQDEASILHVILGCHDHHVYCLECKINNPAERETNNHLLLKWKTKLNAAVFSTPSVIETLNENYVIACSTKGLLLVLKILNGCIVSEHNMQNEVFSSICCMLNIQNAINIYFGCRDNYFYCFQYK